MVNIKSPKCKSCDKIATFNIESKKIPEYCLEHKTDKMIDVVHKKCKFNNCNKIPIFNYQDKNNGLYCYDHKLENMIDVKHIKCLQEDCNIAPHFNYENESKAIYCSEHRLENMINVISKKCIFNNCNTMPYYNYINYNNGLYCNKHKLKDMIDVKSKKCLFDNCTSRPIYNYINEKNGIYCKNHKLENMIDIVNKRCKSNFCNIMINTKKYKNYCVHCFVHLFPDNTISTNYKTKENEIKKFILENHKDKNWICDKIIENGSSKRRPDFLLKLENHNIIIEVDENQHIKYDCTCENKRLMEISKDFNHKNIVLIRFNPDNYTNINNINIESCWNLNKNGTLKIKDINLWNKRLECLNEQINYWYQNKTNKTIEIIQLYYDGFL
jgi:hypothetical protein